MKKRSVNVPRSAFTIQGSRREESVLQQEKRKSHPMGLEGGGEIRRGEGKKEGGPRAKCSHFGDKVLVRSRLTREIAAATGKFARKLLKRKEKKGHADLRGKDQMLISLWGVAVTRALGGGTSEIFGDPGEKGEGLGGGVVRGASK